MLSRRNWLLKRVSILREIRRLTFSLGYRRINSIVAVLFLNLTFSNIYNDPGGAAGDFWDTSYIIFEHNMPEGNS